MVDQSQPAPAPQAPAVEVSAVSLGIGGFLGPAISLATEILKLINSENATKLTRQLLDKQRELNDEEAKGYNSIDSKIEGLIKDINLLQQAVSNELQLFAAKKS
jgi:hypothetical protein